MTIQEKIICLERLGNWIQQKTTELQQTAAQTNRHNRWFMEENIFMALEGIVNQYLTKDKLTDWVNAEGVKENSVAKKVGLILAGNIPLVGFHDWLSVIISGHIPMIKLSEKDQFFLPLFNNYLKEIGFDTQSTFVEKLENFDAVIATGSNNSARYFESYFGKYPHIIRKNRNGIAILNGQETTDELKALGKDVFTYFGLGCRSTSKIYVPKDYNFEKLLEDFRAHEAIIHHNKYKNNFDYNYTLAIMNKVPHLSNGIFLLLEDPALTSRIATVHYEYYTDIDDLEKKLLGQSENIQCVASNIRFKQLATIGFGEAQHPQLNDYADGVNTLTFLTQL